jgi:hypothetical protein
MMDAPVELLAVALAPLPVESALSPMTTVLAQAASPRRERATNEARDGIEPADRTPVWPACPTAAASAGPRSRRVRNPKTERAAWT